jgi:predicted ArsR family transcriptional regulator
MKRNIIRAEGLRTLRALRRHESGATAEVLADQLQLTPGALRRWMSRGCELRLVRAERVNACGGRQRVPRLRYHIQEEGMKWVQRYPEGTKEVLVEALAEGAEEFVKRVPNCVFALGKTSTCAK